MMMAQDSTPTRPSLDEETVAEVRRALSRYLADGDRPEMLAPAMRLLAADARRKSLRAEQVLVALKEIWGELPEVRGAARHGKHEQLLPRVIAMCIDQYYGS
jgi:hypothetical protein